MVTVIYLRMREKANSKLKLVHIPRIYVKLLIRVAENFHCKFSTSFEMLHWNKVAIFLRLHNGTESFFSHFQVFTKHQN